VRYRQREIDSVRLRRLAFACLAGTVGFCVCFFAAKHQPGLARIAPFVEDPYDAVGSFGVQLAAVAAALSTLRALRSYGVDRLPEARTVMIVRSVVVALLAFFVTVIADIVAMIRHPGAWLPTPAGRWLAIFLGLLALSTAGGVGIVLRAARAAGAAVPPSAWRRTAAIVAAGALVLGIYPEELRHSVSGAILTVIVGMSLLFLEVWALALVLVPREPGPFEDLLDDFHALLERVTAATTGSRREAAPDRSRGRAISQCLRAHPWRSVGLIAAAGGFALALSEVFGEGLAGTTRRALLVLGVFTGIEAAGVVLGYALFWRLLGLRRAE
jgi:hypothetical protein